MSTLKKILALTLALAMVLSLNVFAAFKDQDLIDEDCVSACTLMQDLGVLEGVKGNMNPEDSINRAEVATMIYRVMNKGKDDSSNYKGMKLFTDVKEGQWYEGYINYCATMGLVSGVGNGKFNPKGNVKGTEVLKMLLGCLGYKAPHANFTGSGWANRVIAQADEIGLIDEYAPALTANAPRQWVAYLFEKAMGCNMVKWSNDTEEFENSEKGTLGANKFNLRTMVGIVTKIDLDEENGEKAEPTFTVEGTINGETNETTKPFTKFALDTALYGQQVKVNYKDNSDSTKIKVYGVAATGKSVVKTVNIVDLKGTKTTANDTTTYKLTADTELKATENVWTAVKEVLGTPTSSKYNGKLLTGTITLVASEGKVWDYAYANTAVEYATYTVAVKTGNVTIGDTFDSAIKPADLAKNFTTVGEVANKDFVKISKFVTSDGKDFGKLPTVEKLEKQTLKLTQNKAGVYTLGGTAYKQAENDVFFGGTRFFTAATTVGEEYDVYVDGGLIVKAKLHETATSTKLGDNFAMLLAVKDGTAAGWSEATDNLVRVLLLNGETQEFVYKNAAPYKDAAGNSQTCLSYTDINGTTGGVLDRQYEVFEYVMSGEKISFKDRSDFTHDFDLPSGEYGVYETGDDAAVVKLANNYFTGKNDFRFDKNAKFFTLTEKDDKTVAAVMSIADFTGDFKAFAEMITYDDGKSIPTYVMGVMAYEYLGDTTVVYALANGAKYKTTIDDKAKTVVDVTLKDGTVKTFVLATESAVDEPLADALYSYTLNGSGEVKLANVDFTEEGAELKFVQGNEVKAGESILTVKDDAVVVIYNEVDETVEFATLADVTWNTTDEIAEVSYIQNSDNKITLLCVFIGANDN